MKFYLVLILFISFHLLAEDGTFDMKKLNNEIKNPIAYDSTDLMQNKKAQQSIGFVILRIIGSLVIISALVIGFVLWLKKLGVGGNIEPPLDSSLELLQELPLGTTSSVVLVRFEDKVLLLGQGSGGVSHIETINGEDAQKLIAQSAGGKSVGTFRANLNKYVMSLQKGDKDE